MTQVVAPSTSYESTLEAGVTGLVGTLKLGVYDGDTATHALSTAGINEIGTSGVYVATKTAPSVAGQYVLLWTLDGTLAPDQVITEDLLITSTPTFTAPSGTAYITAAELKATLSLTGETFADADIALAVEAASRIIDAYTGTRFYSVSETRYYTAYDGYDRYVAVDDLVTAGTVSMDTAGDATYSETWVEGTDFYLDPPNHTLDGRPSRRLVLRPQARGAFPGYQRAIRITGTFGWPAVPAQVKQAATILAARLFKRARETPYGFVAVTSEMTTAARLGRIDPDVAVLLDSIPGAAVPLFV